MRTILCIGTCYLVMIFTLPIVLLAGDLLGGTWDLDIAASKYDPGPERKSDTRIYRVDGNTIHFTGTVIFADGKSINVEYTGAYHGKDYAVAGNPKVGTIAQERVDDYTAKTTTIFASATVTPQIFPHRENALGVASQVTYRRTERIVTHTHINYYSY
jgi:hypothetical protein